MKEAEIEELVDKTAMDVADEFGYPKSKVPADAIMEHLPPGLSAEMRATAKKRADLWEHQLLLHHVQDPNDKSKTRCGKNTSETTTPVTHILSDHIYLSSPPEGPLCEECKVFWE